MLVKTVNVAIFNKRPFSVDNERTGETYTGFIYEGVDSDGTVHRFTSKTDKFPVHDIGGYTKGVAVDIRLAGYTRMNGSVSWKVLDETPPPSKK